MSTKDNVISNAKELKEITSIGIKAVKRVSEAIETKNTENLNFDAEKVLGRNISATVNSIKTEIMAYRVINDKMY